MKTFLTKTLELGKIVATRNAFNILLSSDIQTALRKHANCLWGDVSDGDWMRNNQALVKGLRVLSAYQSVSGKTFWIITESDRSYTTVLMPEDY